MSKNTLESAEKYAHRGVSGSESSAAPQSEEAIGDALKHGKSIEIDVSSNGLVGHVKDSDIWSGEYDESQTAWENQTVGETDNPRFGDVLWLAARRGSKVLAELKASSPEKAVEAADVAFNDAERVFDALGSHNLDPAGAIEKGDSLSFMSFSVEALDTVAERQAETGHSALQQAPKVLLGTSSPENVHDMSMSATVLSAMESAGIEYAAMPWGHALIELAAHKGYDMVAPHWNVVDDEFMQHAAKYEVAVGVWTVPSDKIDELEAAGVAVIVTEQSVPYERKKMRDKALSKRALQNTRL